MKIYQDLIAVGEDENKRMSFILSAVTDCPLYVFRFGKNPYIKRTMNEEQRKVNAERLRYFRELKNKE